jgi:hypothetical protein
MPAPVPKFVSAALISDLERRETRSKKKAKLQLDIYRLEKEEGMKERNEAALESCKKQLDAIKAEEEAEMAEFLDAPLSDKEQELLSLSPANRLPKKPTRSALADGVADLQKFLAAAEAPPQAPPLSPEEQIRELRRELREMRAAVGKRYGTASYMPAEERKKFEAREEEILREVARLTSPEPSSDDDHDLRF